jgi:hypothetical protein
MKQGSEDDNLILLSFMKAGRVFAAATSEGLHVAPPAAVAGKHEEEDDEGREKQTSTRRKGNERACCGKSFESHSIASPPQSSPQHLVDIMVSL